MIYIFIYGIFLLIGIYDIKKKGLLKEKSRNALLNLMILVLTLFRGLRWNTGTDWEQFLEVFQYVDEDSALVFIRNTGEILEPGYTFLNYLVKCIFVWGIERSGFFNGREKWAKGFENQRV